MSVYVDNMEAKFGNMIMCHMWADSPLELKTMAFAIGVNVKWMQIPPKASWVHFDIAKSKRMLAVRLGAIEKSWRDIPEAARLQRANPLFVVYY